MEKIILTSESVTEGHPDKVCDYVADCILDAYLEKDADSHVACEVSATTGIIFVMGEISSKAQIDVSSVVRRAVKELGYTRGKYGFDAENLAVIVAIDPQSCDIKDGIKEDGAGDQGTVFGYATNETKAYMPLPIYLAHRLSQRLSECRKQKLASFLRPDGKTQVSIEYQNGKAVRIDSIVVSAQHGEDVELDGLRKFVAEEVIKKEIPEDLLSPSTKYYINPAGRFSIGGPKADSGLCGRKIIADNYGNVAHHGGGSFSGKDPTKVDRSGAYMARYIAKNLVASGFADRLEISLSYVIGRPSPIAINVDTFNTEKVGKDVIMKAIKEVFPLSVKGIIEELDLKKPIYHFTTNYGHFGRPGFNWEKLDKISVLRKYLQR